MKRTITLLIFAFTSISALATGTNPDLGKMFPVLQCPAVGEEYASMIGKLETIKTSIKDKGNCKNVELQVDTLKKLLDDDRQKVLDIVAKGKDVPLSEVDSDLVRKYAESLTKKVASLNDLFLNGNQCFSEDASGKQLGALAGFVGEASTLIGSVAGPYGVPIALAGNVIAGFLTGLDQVLKSRAGFDFSKRDQWQSYVQNLCTYNSFRGQIDHLLDPGTRIEKLKVLRTKLENQLAAMSGQCSECQKIAEMVQQAPGADAATIMQLVGSDVAAADQQFAKPYGTYTVQNIGLRNWATQEIDRMEAEAATEWGNASGQYLLTRAKQQIEDFLMTREAPQFLNFQVKQALADSRQFTIYINQNGREIYSGIEQIDPKAITYPVTFGWTTTDPLEVFRSLVLRPINWEALPANDVVSEAHDSWANFRATSLLNLRTSQTTAKVAQAFCSFFKNTEQYSSAIRAQCSAPDFKALVIQQVGLDKEISQIKHTDIQQSRLINPAVLDRQVFAKDPIDSITKTIEARAIGN